MLPTTPQEVCMAINFLKLNKASGNDDIHPFFLKMAAQSIASPLSMLINSCFTYGIFPNKLKLAKVVPVFKTGPSNMLTSYRPISLLPSLSKLIERLICNRLLSFFTRNNTIVPTQYGFRHNRSIIHAILDLITSCLDNIHNKKFSTMIFLDIKKAFDSVSHNKLLKKLDYYGIRGVANLLLKSYLNDRKQYELIDNQKSSEKIIECGIPQGSIPGLLLFLIYVNDQPSCLETVPRFFADDTALLIDSNNTTELQTLTNTELANINQWMTANNVVVNANKAIALNISPNMRNNIDTLSYVFNGETVCSSDSAKYLGITIDNQLSFKTHISNLESKIARSVGVIAKLSYYLPHDILLTLYYSLVHSHFLYALPVGAFTHKTYLTKLLL